MNGEKLQSFGKVLLAHPEWLDYAKIAMTLLSEKDGASGDNSFLAEFLKDDDQPIASNGAVVAEEEGSRLPVAVMQDETASAAVSSAIAHRHNHREFLLALKPYLGKERQKSLELLLKFAPILELLSDERGDF